MKEENTEDEKDKKCDRKQDWKMKFFFALDKERRRFYPVLTILSYNVNLYQQQLL